MANYRTLLSVLFPVGSAGNVAPALALYRQFRDGMDETGEWIGFAAEANDASGNAELWLHSDEDADIEHVTAFAVRFAQARAFIARHHAHCPPPVAWRLGIGVANGHQLIGVATVGNPVARALNGRGIVEVNRLCVRRDIAPLLCWNAASMLYGAAGRAAERAGFRSIITYTHETEDGTSLRAAGWNRDGLTGGQSWHRPGRSRSNRNAYVRKVRWSRTLHPRAKPAPRPGPPPSPAAAPLWIGDPASPGPCSM